MQIEQRLVSTVAFGQVPVVQPSGEVDMHHSPQLRKELLAQIGLKPKRLVVNMAGVKFIDSSGVATLVEAMKACKSAGTQLLLCSMDSKVKDVFELARLEKVFRICGSEEEALSD